MASITSSGLGSGLDINNIISQLMTIEQQPLTVLATKEASYQAKLSAFGSLKGALSSLQTAAKTLTAESTFSGMSASSSDSTAVSTSATTSAAAGSYSISVTQLAKYHSISSIASYSSTTETFHPGTLSISVGSGTPVSITIDSSNNTLAGIRQAINDADAGVTANIIYDGAIQRLVLTSNTLGSAGGIAISGSDTLPVSTGTHSLDDFDFSGSATATMEATQTADDAIFKLGNIALTRSSNTITDAIEGVTLNLLKGTATSPGNATVTVAKNSGTVTTAVNAFVKAYNDAINGIKQMTAYDAANGKSSVLTGDGTARSIQAQLSALVQQPVTGITGGISRLSDIGISIQKDGTLAVDSSKLATAIADPDTDVMSFFTQTTSGNEGIAVRFNSLLDRIAGNDGLIENRTDGITASIKDIEKRAESLQLRLASIEKRYRAQFTALDTLVASMNQTSTYLAQQLANLPSINSSTK